jgi:hypothetical protein
MLAGLTPGGITQVAAAGTLDQQQTTSNNDVGFPIVGTRQVAQTFTAGISGNLDQVNLLLRRPAGSAGDLTVQIKATTGGTPSGLPLASATVPAASVSFGQGWVSVPLSPTTSIAGMQYAIVLSSPGSCDIDGCYSWGGNVGDPYSRGDPFVSTDSGATWFANPSYDLAFQTFVTPLPPPPTCDERDGEGDIEGEHHTDKDDPQHHHRAHFHIDEDNCEDHDGHQVDMEDPDSGTKFHSTHINSVSFNKAASALTITGTGLDNGVPVSFIAVAVDHGATALDTFSIVLSDGYSNAGHLLKGAVTLH